MENIITHFNFQSTHQVRIVINDQGEPLFCLKDVAIILGIQDTQTKNFNLDAKGVEKIPTPTKGGIQHITFINEPNLYRVIFRSNKKEARAFQDWVFNDVLPSIRKTGSYTTPTTAHDRAHLRQAVSLLVRKKQLDYATAYQMVHQYMNVNHIDEIEHTRLPVAVEYVHQLALGNNQDLAKLTNCKSDGIHQAKKNKENIDTIVNHLSEIIKCVDDIETRNIRQACLFNLLA